MGKIDHAKLNRKIKTSKAKNKRSFVKATPKQIKLLKRLKCNVPKGMSKEAASLLIKSKLKKLNN